MTATRVLRRLAEQHDYVALQDACRSIDQPDPETQVLLALAAAGLGDPPAARQRLASLDHRRLPQSARVDVAAVLLALGELDRAAALLEGIHADGADEALRLARLGWCRRRQGRTGDALALYRRSVDLHPFIAAYQGLLQLYRDSGCPEEMPGCLQSAWAFWDAEQAHWAEAPRRLQSRHLHALQLDAWLGMGDYDTAEAWVERLGAILDEDQWSGLVIDLADRLSSRDRHAHAEAWLRRGLVRYPRQSCLYARLGELADSLGRRRQAIALLRRAIRLATLQQQPTAGLWTQLSATALIARPKLARAAAEQAVAALAHDLPATGGDGPGVADQVQIALAGVEAREQRFPAAEARYRAVLARRPRAVAALHGLGQMLMQVGRIGEAVSQFEQVSAIDPARGHGALIAAGRVPDHADALQRLETLADTPGTDSSLRASLQFQIATAWDRRGQHNRAFALAERANASVRGLLSYDPQAHRQYCARIRHAFNAALYQHRADCGHPSTLPVFVVGMPRSGTTLVEQILAGHSRVHGAGELGVIPRIIAGLERWERRTGSGRTYPDCVDDLDPLVSRGLAEHVLAELREYSDQADRIVDKLPHNFENIGLIRLLLPNARVISVRRDPRDIAVSNYFTDYAGRHGGMAFAYDLDWIGEQLADHNLLMQHWQKIWPEGVLEIRYEDIVDDPQTSARRLLGHIGLPWEPQVLEFASLRRPVRTASVWQVRQPLYTTSKSRWRNYRRQLGPLIAATNRRIVWDPIDMATLPQPGWLNAGVDRYRVGDFDAAERRFKLLLQHLPDHAAARFMLGMVYLHKGHSGDAIGLMEQALQRCPWNRHWRHDLVQAYRLAGRQTEAETLERDGRAADVAPEPADASSDDELGYLFLSEDTACAHPGPARSGTHS